ncbi:MULTISPECIES: DUF1778 domain-containing protein [unclassified Acinetobacter]|uniref:type II toxin -antitoxin system TacA 1-like antitoxin n=1 Tax=unclassified Acinetobacter TaxID=196816 RepID=UPI0035B9F27C
MIIDLQPQTVQIIMNVAKAQGVTADELLQSVFKPCDPTLNSDISEIKLDAEQAEFVQQLLDNPPPPNAQMQKLLALRGNHV